MDKWSYSVYHSLECMRELSAAEDHLIHKLSEDSDDKLKEILEKIRIIRKKIEGSALGD